uniref:Uncharacterized protein n=1 Tax=Lactuca sativa TaxID=4236 RepID=A0A9R1VVP3_LACSA|nr:hypothetical protein LSAT_V11C400196590 [Lactuca sativa]
MITLRIQYAKTKSDVIAKSDGTFVPRETRKRHEEKGKNMIFASKKLWGHDLAHHELFLYTHTKNHNGVTFLVEKAKKIHDDFMERSDQLEAIREEIDEDKLFYDVVWGHDRKKRLYGFGSYGKHIRSSKESFKIHHKQ